MKTRKIVSIFSIAIILISCSDLKKNIPTAEQSGTSIHPQGWVDTTSTNFHGNTIANVHWDMNNCKQCHGPHYNGGITNVSCFTCHNKTNGPENCTTCHGSVNAAPPRDLSGNTTPSSPGVGAHQSHLLGIDSVGAAVACNECHLVPTALNSPSHIDSTAGAEIVFNGSVVSSSLAGLAGTGRPIFSDSTMKCNNTYCHGYFPNGNKTSPVWNDITGQYSACGSCHGDVSKSTIGDKALPKIALNGGNHPNNTQCSVCHSSAISAGYKLNLTKHINGQIDF